jgi:hypothetical protein
MNILDKVDRWINGDSGTVTQWKDTSVNENARYMALVRDDGKILSPITKTQSSAPCKEAMESLSEARVEPTRYFGFNSLKFL